MAGRGQRGRDLLERVGAGRFRAVEPACRQACRAATRTACSRRGVRHRARRTAGGRNGRCGRSGRGSGLESGHARGRVRTASGRRRSDRVGRGDAQALPFAEASFDVVCCQLGLQFFPDREHALREMKRVLVPGGRAVVMVWREIDRAPGFAVLAAALGRTISADAEALMRAPFALGDAGELARLLESAGLRGCAIDAENRERPLLLGGDVRRQLHRRLTTRCDRCGGSGTGLRTACEGGRACPRPAHTARLAALPDRGASRACRA
jgi:SAM-dependent methyltransferase